MKFMYEHTKKNTFLGVPIGNHGLVLDFNLEILCISNFRASLLEYFRILQPSLFVSYQFLYRNAPCLAWIDRGHEAPQIWRLILFWAIIISCGGFEDRRPQWPCSQPGNPLSTSLATEALSLMIIPNELQRPGGPCWVQWGNCRLFFFGEDVSECYLQVFLLTHSDVPFGCVLDASKMIWILFVCSVFECFSLNNSLIRPCQGFLTSHTTGCH